MASTSETYSSVPGFEGVDVVSSQTKRVKCSGSGGALGHPVTWLDMGLENQVQCKYCDRVFMFEGTLGDGDGNAAT